MIGGHFKQLDENECRHLLRTGVIGRVGWFSKSGLTILPVSYVIENDLVVFRTWSGTELASLADGAEACFEVDYFDDDAANGWSVLVRGEAKRAPEPLTRPMPFSPSAIDETISHDSIAITLTTVTGRAVSAPYDE